MKNLQLITRKGNFDSGHRVMNEQYKCYLPHGHTYNYELSFSFEHPEEIGYAIDFKEIKRVFCEFIEEYFDHGMILNPKDEILIKATKDLNGKLWLMSLNGSGEYCNPSVENIAKELFIAMNYLCELLYGDSGTGLKIHQIKIFETPNCWTDCYRDSYTTSERINFENQNRDIILDFARKMGVLNYDDRKN